MKTAHSATKNSVDTWPTQEHFSVLFANEFEVEFHYLTDQNPCQTDLAYAWIERARLLAPARSLAGFNPETMVTVVNIQGRDEGSTSEADALGLL